MFVAVMLALLLVDAASALAIGTPGVSRDLRAGAKVAPYAKSTPCSGGSLGNPNVQPPNSSTAGKSYGQWGGAWWQWVFSVPYPSTPLFDSNGSSCGLNQSGPVWFLAGSAVGPVTRSCTVPADKYLFFPLANLEDDYPCPDPNFHPAPGQSLQDFLTQDANNIINTFVNPANLFASVDGAPVGSLPCYRGTSGLFTFTGDPALTTVFDPCITGSPQQAVADGYWLMLAPLRPGQHTLHFGSTDFGQDITYNLTIQK
jgi:hypothetical protein